MKKLFQFFILGVLLLPFIGSAQNRDFGVWTSVAVNKDLVKGISLSLEEDVRIEDNARRLSTAYTELSLGYKLNKTIRFKAAYRFIQDNSFEGVIENKHGLLLDVNFRYEYERIRLDGRYRFQSKNSGPIGNFGENPGRYNRYRISAHYNIKDSRFDPYFSIEAYHCLSPVNGRIIDKMRYSAGTEYGLKKKLGTLDLYIRLQQQVQVPSPSSLFILGIGYSYDL